MVRAGKMRTFVQTRFRRDKKHRKHKEFVKKKRKTLKKEKLKKKHFHIKIKR